MSNELNPEDLERLKEAILRLTDSVAGAAEKIAKETGVSFSDLNKSVQAGTELQDKSNKAAKTALSTAEALEKSEQEKIKTLKETEEQLTKLTKTFKNTQEQQGKVFKTGAMLNQVFGTTGASTEAFQKQAGRISSALSNANYQLEQLQKQQANGEPVNKDHIKTVQSQIKTLKSQEYSLKFVTEASGLVRNGFGQLGQLLIKQYQIEAQYQGQYMQLMSQGADGFALLGASLNKSVDMTNAASQAMASFAQTAGQAMANMGGKVLPLVGLGLTLLGKASSAAADAAAQLAKQGIAILMAEGTKLIKTYHDMTQSGLIFSNGMGGMIAATAGTKLRLEEMAAVVKDNRDAFADIGMGLSKAATYIGGVSKLLASTTGKFAYADRQLLALGYSYQEQAALAADNASQLANSKGPAAQSEVAQATIEMAKNMALVAEVTGEDAKARKKAAQEEMANAAFQAKLAQLRETDPKKAKAIEDSIRVMDKRSAKIAADMFINNGQAILQSNAVAMSLNSGQAKQMKEWYSSVQDGTASSEKSLEIEKKYSKEKRQGAMAQESVNKAAFLGKGGGVVKEQAESNKDILETTRKEQNTKSVAEAKKEQNTLTEGVKPGGNGDKTTKVLVEAQELGAVAAKTMQEIAINKLPQFLEEMRKAVNAQIAALKAAGIPTSAGDKYSKILEKWLPLILGAVLAWQGVKGIKGFADDMKSMLKGKGKGKEGVAESLQKGAPKAVERVERAGKFDKSQLLDKSGKELKGAALDARMNKLEKAGAGIEKAAENSKGLMGKVTEKFSSSVKGPLGKLVKGTAILGTVLNVGMAVKDVADAQKNYEKAKKAGDKEGMKEARSKQGEAVGSAAGGVAGAALGTLLGGPIGTAIGGFLGAELGGMLGKYAGPYWDMVSSGIGKAYDTVKTGITAFMKKIPEYFHTAMKWITNLPDKIKDGMHNFGQWLKDAIKQLPASLKTVFKSIKDGVMGIFGGIGKIKWGDVFKGIGSTLLTIATSTFKAVLALGTGLFDIFKEVGPVLYDAVKDIGSWIWDGVKDLGLMMLEGLKVVPDMLWKGVKDLGTWAWEGLKDLAPKVWDALKDTGAKLWEGVKDIGKWVWDGVKNIGSKLWDGVKNIGSKLWDGVKDIGTWIWDGVKDIGSKLWKTLKGLAPMIWNGVKDIGKWVWDGVKDIGARIWESIKDIGKWVWDGLKGLAPMVWNALKDTGAKLWDGIKAIPGLWWDAVKGIGEFAWKALKGLAPMVWDGLKDTGAKLWNGVKDIGTWLRESVKDIGKWVWDGVKDIGTWVWNGVKDIGSKLWDGVKDIGSKLWDGVKDIGTWVWEGVKDIGKWVWDGVKDIGSKLWDGVKDIGTWIWNGVKDIGTRLYDTVKNIGSWIWDGIKNSPISRLGEFVMGSLSKLGTWVWEQLGGIATKVWDSLKGIGGWIWDAIKNSPIAKLGTWIFDAIKNSPVGKLGSWIGDMVMAGVGKVKEWMGTFMDWIKEKAQSLIPDWVKSMMGDKPKPAVAAPATQAPAPVPAPATAKPVVGAPASAPAPAATAPAKPSATNASATAKPVAATPAQATPTPVQAGPKSPSPAPTATAPSKSVPPPTATPTEKALTPEEKKDVNATIATHTKYTNDLLTALKNDMGATNRQMIAQLAQLASYASNTADATKKIQKQGA